MPLHPSNQSYSSDVQLRLVVNGRVLELAQISPGGFVIRQPEDLPPCEAEIVMYVDDDQSRWPVYLVEGMSKDEDSVKTVPR